MHKIKIDKQECTLPSHWNELSAGALQYLWKLTEKSVTPSEVKIKMLLYCLDAQVLGYKKDGGYSVKIKKHKYTISAEQMQPLCDIFNFLYTFKEVKKKQVVSLDSRLFKIPYPFLKIGRKIYKGYDNAMGEMPYEKFSTILVYMDMIDKKPNYIDNIISVIYSAEAKNPEDMPKETDCYKLPQMVKNILLWYIQGSNDFMYNKFPRTFSGKATSNDSAFDNQMKMIDALAQNDLTKKEAVKKAPLLDALFTLECACENKEKEKQKSVKK